MDDHLTKYKYQCYDELSSRARSITDQLQLFNYYDIDEGLYDLIEDKLILQTMNTYTKYVVACQTFNEVTLLSNIILDQLLPIDSELEKLHAKLKEKQRSVRMMK